MCTSVKQATMITDLELHRLDPRTIKLDRVLVFIGRRDTGKTTLLVDILYHVRNRIADGIVISGTEAGNGFWGQYVPSSFVYNEFSEEVLWRVINRQKRRVQEGDIDPEHPERAPPTFVILDDCMHDEAMLRNSKALMYIFVNGRHLNIFLCLIMQYPLGIKPSMRSNIDYCFLLRNQSNRDRQVLFENFGGVVPTKSLFNTLMDEFTEDRHALVLNNTVQKNDISQTVFWYKAKLREKPFRIGSKTFHRYSMRYAERSQSQSTRDKRKKASRTLMRQLNPSDARVRINVRKAL